MHDIAHGDGEESSQLSVSVSRSRARPESQTPVEVFVEDMATDLALADPRSTSVQSAC